MRKVQWCHSRSHSVCRHIFTGGEETGGRSLSLSEPGGGGGLSFAASMVIHTIRDTLNRIFISFCSEIKKIIIKKPHTEALQMCEEKELCAPASPLPWASSINSLHTKTSECSNLLWTCRGQCSTSFPFSASSLCLLVPMVGRSFSFLQDAATYLLDEVAGSLHGTRTREGNRRKREEEVEGVAENEEFVSAMLKTAVFCLIPEEFSCLSGRHLSPLL